MNNVRMPRHVVLVLAAAWMSLGAAVAAIVQPAAEVVPSEGGAAAVHREGTALQKGTIHLPGESATQVQLNQLTTRATAGDVDAMLALGYHYYTRPSLPQALPQARKWWAQAADAGDLRAMTALGHLLSVGSGVRDLAESRRRLEHAAALGFPRALYVLSTLTRQGTGPKSLQLAKRQLQEAADAGDVMAINDLGVELELAGQPDAAMRLYQQAEQAGVDVARQNLQRLKRGEAHQHDENTLKRLELLAAEGDADALLALAHRYHRGDGVVRDFTRAIGYYQRAADAGSAQARTFLGLIFSRTGSNGATIDEAWMQELAARINAADQWRKARRPPALTSPTRITDPLVDLLTPLPKGASSLKGTP